MIFFDVFGCIFLRHCIILLVLQTQSDRDDKDLDELDEAEQAHAEKQVQVAA